MALAFLKDAGKYKWLVVVGALVVGVAWVWHLRITCERERMREGFLPMLLGMPSLAASLIPMFAKKGGGGSSTPKPYVPPAGPPVVAVYKDSHFRGIDKFFGVGDYPDLGSWGDAISSLRIPSTLKVSLYQKKDFGGKRLDLLGNDHFALSHFAFNDVMGAKEGTWAGRDVCGGGNTHCWNDTASSMKVYT